MSAEAVTVAGEEVTREALAIELRGLADALEDDGSIDEAWPNVAEVLRAAATLLLADSEVGR